MNRLVEVREKHLNLFFLCQFETETNEETCRWTIFCLSRKFVLAERAREMQNFLGFVDSKCWPVLVTSKFTEIKPKPKIFRDYWLLNYVFSWITWNEITSFHRLMVHQTLPVPRYTFFHENLLMDFAQNFKPNIRLFQHNSSTRYLVSRIFFPGFSLCIGPPKSISLWA